MTIKIIYVLITIISALLIGGYVRLIKKKDLWFILLFSSVFIINCGYLALSLAGSLDEALLANRVAYLGSVFLPLCMLMIIMNACGIVCPKWAHYVLFIVSAVVFIIAASQGYTDWYYKDVSLIYVDGAAKLVKDYGTLHSVYYLYLFTYIAAMAAVIAFAYLYKKVFNWKHASALFCITFGNVSIWFVEQLIRIDFEFLSISYIVTEFILLLLYGMLQDYGIIDDLTIVKEKVREREDEAIYEESEEELSGEVCEETYDIEMLKKMHPEVNELTTRELEVLVPILQNKKRKEIAELFNVTEHTIKKHTAHIYLKLEVSNRKELHEKLKL